MTRFPSLPGLPPIDVNGGNGTVADSIDLTLEMAAKPSSAPDVSHDRNVAFEVDLPLNSKDTTLVDDEIIPSVSARGLGKRKICIETTDQCHHLMQNHHQVWDQRSCKNF